MTITTKNHIASSPQLLLLRSQRLFLSFFFFLLTQICCCYTAAAHEAIFLGSSGLVGGLVLDELLASDTWETIHTIVRKPSGRRQHNSKIHEIVVPDLKQMLQNEELIQLATSQQSKNNNNKVTAAFHTLGVNDAFGWTLQQLLDIEVTLTDLFTKYSHEYLGIEYISVLSMVDAIRGGESFSEEELSTEITFWNIYDLSPRIKGTMEEVVVNSGIPYCVFFQPSNFETDHYRFGMADAIFQLLFRILNWALPKQWHSIHVKDLAHTISQFAEKAMEEIDTLKNSYNNKDNNDDEEEGNNKKLVHQDVKLTYVDFKEVIDSKDNKEL